MSIQRHSELINLQPREAAGPVLDKKAWHREVELATEEARRDDSHLSVVFIDVNYFKDINDTLGHTKGDEVIEAVHQILAKNLRTQYSEKRPVSELDSIAISRASKPEFPAGLKASDVQAGHIGGDEFGILCKTDEKGARVLVDRIRFAFDEYKKSPEGKDLEKLGISLAIGASTLEPGWDSTDLLSDADLNMYRDKESQLKPLNEVQRKFLNNVAEGLEEYDIRIRDLGKYLVMLSQKNKALSE